MPFVQRHRLSRRLGLLLGAWLCTGAVGAQVLNLESLPRPTAPPAEKGPVVPSQVLRWRQEAQAHEYGDGAPRDPVLAAPPYCRAAPHRDPGAHHNPAPMLT